MTNSSINEQGLLSKISQDVKKQKAQDVKKQKAQAWIKTLKDDSPLRAQLAKLAAFYREMEMFTKDTTLFFNTIYNGKQTKAINLLLSFAYDQLLNKFSEEYYQGKKEKRQQLKKVIKAFEKSYKNFKEGGAKLIEPKSKEEIQIFIDFCQRGLKEYFRKYSQIASEEDLEAFFEEMVSKAKKISRKNNILDPRVVGGTDFRTKIAVFLKNCLKKKESLVKNLLKMGISNAAFNMQEEFNKNYKELLELLIAARKNKQISSMDTRRIRSIGLRLSLIYTDEWTDQNSSAEWPVKLQKLKNGLVQAMKILKKEFVSDKESLEYRRKLLKKLGISKEKN
jgi:hypothetical protein